MAPRAQEALKPRHRVLIIDDEESTRLLLARLLSKDLGVEAQLAGTCEQALKLAGNYAYDAILLDLLMPGVGGLGVLAAIRAASPNAATPVIIVSVVSDPETMERCKAAGASAYHLKPIRRAELIASVRAQLAGRGKPKRPQEDDG
jgi:DNA-binding response OmpR family regulator